MSGFLEILRKPPGTLSGLDFLRTLAILLVFSTHFTEDYSRVNGHSGWEKFPLFYFGWTGVDLFFVLSGFLIGRQLWREIQKTGQIRVGRFILKRGLRIWPLYYATLAFLILVLNRHQGVTANFLPDLFCISNYRQGILSGGWSLSTEEQFYILIPLLLLALIRWVPGRFRVAVPAVLLVALPLIRWLTLLSNPAAAALVPLPADLLYSPFHTHSDGLVMGVLLSSLSVSHPHRFLHRGIFNNLLLPLLMIALGIVFRKFDKDLFAFTSLALIFGGMTLFFLRDQTQWLSRLTQWHGFHLISRLSYGIYLNHFEILTPSMAPLSHWLGGYLGTGILLCSVIYAITLLLSIGVAWLTYALIEYPFLRLRDRLLSSSH